MLALRKPTDDALRSFLAGQAETEFSYPEVGATDAELPKGYTINHTSRHLGHGLAAFEAACEALRSWQQLRLGWVDCWPTDAPLQAGVDIAVIGRALGLYWLNACRIAYVIDERSGNHGRESFEGVSRIGVNAQRAHMRFGYAHGTLPDHLAIGEERFVIEMNCGERVSIDILSFSKPNTFLARLGYPLIRRSQRRFLQESSKRVEQFVAHRLNAPAADNQQARRVSRQLVQN